MVLSRLEINWNVPQVCTGQTCPKINLLPLGLNRTEKTNSGYNLVNRPRICTDGEMPRRRLSFVLFIRFRMHSRRFVLFPIRYDNTVESETYDGVMFDLYSSILLTIDGLYSALGGRLSGQAPVETSLNPKIDSTAAARESISTQKHSATEQQRLIRTARLLSLVPPKKTLPRENSSDPAVGRSINFRRRRLVVDSTFRIASRISSAREELVANGNAHVP